MGRQEEPRRLGILNCKDGEKRRIGMRRNAIFRIGALWVFC